MSEQITLIVLSCLGGFILGYYIFRNKLKTEEQNRSIMSRQLAGTYVEKLIPFMKECKYDPKDMFFLGKPIDYIVFNRSGDEKVSEIVFLEVKTGNSQLSEREESLKKAIENKSVSWVELRI